MSINDIITYLNSPELYNNINLYLNSGELQKTLVPLKIAIILLLALCLFLITYFIFKTSYVKLLFLQDLFEIVTYRPYGLKKVEKQWKKIIKRLESGKEAEYKLAVIEADSMMDSILKKMGYSGKNLEDRLKQLTEASIHNLSELSDAHKIRDNIVHDPDYRLSLENAEKTLAIYEEAFKNIQAL